MGEKLLIIGAGIGGLSAGIYALKNGYDVDIFEMHNRPGGLCTTWQRHHYLFDGCIHFLLGTVPASSLHQFWQELGATQSFRISSHDIYLHVENRSGESFRIYKNSNLLLDHIRSIAGGDAAVMRTFCDDVVTLSRMPSSIYRIPTELLNTPQGSSILKEIAPFLQLVRRLCSTTIRQTFNSLASRIVKDGFNHLLPDCYSLFSLAWILSCFHTGDGNWVMGGSAQLSEALYRTFTGLGGRVHYDHRVKKIMTRLDKVIGVQLSDNTTIAADTVIAAISAQTVLSSMVDRHYSSLVLKECYDRFEPIPAIIQVSLGINADLSSFPQHLCLELESPVRIAGRVVSHLVLRHYCHDPAMAPAGKSVVTSLLFSPFDFWASLKNEPNSYADEKEKVAEMVIACVKKRYGVQSGAVETIDVATPLTYERMAGVWRGAYNGWMHTPQSALVTVPKTLPGLRNFYFAGQWVAPGGGLPLAAASGCWAVQLMQAAKSAAFQYA
ncbi:MAG: NAD(P)/FAD-dependent oxidoreductase [Chitinivibrionales bacterium]|nr:NAD(P)/FAD-dependent oxidoreductase [Chitinivibrionales bacterium]